MYKLVVFDLDYTLWDYGSWIEHTNLPFHKRGKLCYDNIVTCLKLYSDVIDFITSLKSKDYKIGVVSRTNAPELAEKLLYLYDINHYFFHK